MDSWNVLLQLDGFNGKPGRRCTRYAMPGVALPAQISIVACDSVAVGLDTSLHGQIACRLGGVSHHCDGPRPLDCMAWREPACRHVLVLLIGQQPLNLIFETLAKKWLSRGSANAVVLPVLIGGVSHDKVFPGHNYPVLSRCQAVTWGGSVSRLAEIVMAAALIDRKPGVFVSYLRKEASAGAEQIFDALSHAGFRVFLDRFSGTAGRIFPHELAEAMADMGLVVLLETDGLKRSRWTMWEAAFARRYRIGPIAINFDSAPKFHSVAARLDITDDPAAPLPTATVDAIIGFIRQEHLKVALGRRAYYESLIRLAAHSRHGEARAVGAGVLELVDHRATTQGFALPSGAPGQLKHVRRLVEAASTGRRLLAGEHQHLPPTDRADLVWLSREKQVELAGSASIYDWVRHVL